MDVGDSFTTFRDYWKRWKLLETLNRHFLLFLHPLKFIFLSLSLSLAVSSLFASSTMDNFPVHVQSQQWLIDRYLSLSFPPSQGSDKNLIKLCKFCIFWAKMSNCPTLQKCSARKIGQIKAEIKGSRGKRLGE